MEKYKCKYCGWKAKSLERIQKHELKCWERVGIERIEEWKKEVGWV
jgi:hypothetical protein